jgi:hypothetical protein
MTNAEHTVCLMVHRLVGDYDGLPASMRKPAGPDQITNYQKHCGAFLVVKQHFHLLVPADAVNTEWPAIENAFMSGCMDHTLGSAVDAGMWPFNMDSVPEVKSILLRLEADIDQKQLDRHDELRAQVQAATFMQLKEQLDGDTRRLEVYFAKVHGIRQSWANTLIAHKRRRYAMGLERARKFMDERLLLHVVEPNGMHVEVNAFKKSFADNLPAIKDVCADVVGCGVGCWSWAPLLTGCTLLFVWCGLLAGIPLSSWTSV